MKSLYLYNSLSKQKEEFKPIKSPHVGLYTCGPTVYDFPQIGNWRTYTMADVLYRVLLYLGYKVNYTMNLTDVGHLSGDNQGDSSQGIDRMEKAEKKEGKTAWEIADFYGKDFIASLPELGILMPNVIARATEHIKEQIELLLKIEAKGFAYKIDDGIYFDTKAYETAGGVTGELTTLDQILEGARIEPNKQKRDPRDFALWKFSPKGQKRHMEWESPWGIGFPGWHLECSAMSMKYLGEQFDIHCGGEDIKATHHPNEILQSESATGKRPFVKYWVHGAFLKVDGGRMGKSLGNAYTIYDIKKKGFRGFDVRYLYFTTHYRQQLNFSWEALEGAKTALKKLYVFIDDTQKSNIVSTGANTKGQGRDKSLSDLQKQAEEFKATYRDKFLGAVFDDLNMPKAVGVLWEMVGEAKKDGMLKRASLELLWDWEAVLGLRLNQKSEIREQRSEIGNQKSEIRSKEISTHVSNLLLQREKARTEKDWQKADEIRKEIEKLGFTIEDTSAGSKLVR